MAITTVWRLDMKAVRQMIAEVLSLPDTAIFEANTEKDISKLSHFVTVLAAYQNEIGAEILYDGINEAEHIGNLSELTLSVNAYGENAYEVINKLVSSMRLTPVWDRLRKMHIGYLRSSQIRSLPVTISGGKEQRAQVDLIFSISNKIKADVQRGDTVQIITQGENQK